MTAAITAINLPLPYRMGSVNCYLVRVANGYILIDTGPSKKRSELESEMAKAGCRPGNLKLILLTHGDFDHTGNAAYLRQKYATKIAMHGDDAGMAERGDISWNRKKGKNPVFRKTASVLFRFSQAQRFSPDLHVEDGQALTEYGWDATVVHIPGHSRGSIGVLTPSGDFFCGDLIENGKKPKLNSIMDDRGAANASLDRLAKLPIGTVYPGHGNPFAMEAFLQSRL